MSEKPAPVAFPHDGSDFLAYDPVSGRFGICQWKDGDDPHIDATEFDPVTGARKDPFDPGRTLMWWPLPKVKQDDS